MCGRLLKGAIMGEASCASCRFHRTVEYETNAGPGLWEECLRRAPIVFDGGRHAHWPVVELTDWCGEQEEVCRPSAD